ncbi:MAG: hypothetical protein IPN18_18530 [Ignavibacteriales bacterium]|nr:hypothetical protein [Ignavibacteriales bacterium]
MAVSEEGREIPLLIIADPMPEKPEDLKKAIPGPSYTCREIFMPVIEGKGLNDVCS